MLKVPEISRALNMEEMGREGGDEGEVEGNKDAKLNSVNEDPGLDDGNQVAGVDVGVAGGGDDRAVLATGGKSFGKSVRFAPGPTTKEPDEEHDMKSI